MCYYKNMDNEIFIRDVADFFNQVNQLIKDDTLTVIEYKINYGDPISYHIKMSGFTLSLNQNQFEGILYLLPDIEFTQVSFFSF